jgi:hypothetical protein
VVGAGFCTFHEYRFSYGLVALTGVFTGLIDATIEDWSVKAFAWAGAVLFYALVASYEFIVMETPPRPLLQAGLFVFLGLAGFLSSHHWTWLVMSILLGKPVEKVLWLAPHMYVNLSTYTTLMILSFTAYTAYLVYINVEACEVGE